MKHGIVTSKKVASEGHMALTVQSSRAGVTWKNVPVAQQHPGDIQNIEEGWHVALDQCDDGLWIVVGVLNTDPALLPDSLSDSERSMKFDDGTEISVRGSDGNYNVSITGSGDVTINATGNVTIGDAANAVKLAVQNHTHDYDDSTIADTGDGTGTSSTTTKTTTKPKEKGTDSLIE